MTLVPSIHTSRQPESRMLALQTLYFVIERHWADLFLDIQAELLTQLLSLTKDSDLDIQQWTFICLTSICTKRSMVAPSKDKDLDVAPNGSIAILDRGPEELSIWQEIWVTAFRRMNLASGAACRSACLMAHALMLSSFIPEASVSTSLASFFEQIITQGPAYTCDAVCAFVKVALDHAERDTKLYRLDHHQKVMVWFRCNWRITQDIRSGHTAVYASVSPEAIELLAKIAGSLVAPTIWTETPVIVSDIFQYMIEELETSPIRNYLLNATLPVQSASHSMDRPLPADTDSIALETSLSRSDVNKTRQILDLLHDTVRDVLATIDCGSAMKAKNLADICVFAILMLAITRDAQEEPEHIAVETTCDLFERVLKNVLEEGSYGVQEQAGLFSSFIPILGQPGSGRLQHGRSRLWTMLAIPDARAGVTTLLALDQPEALEHIAQWRADGLLATVWQTTRVSRLRWHLPLGRCRI